MYRIATPARSLLLTRHHELIMSMVVTAAVTSIVVAGVISLLSVTF
jgi:hypothetical protein